MRAIDTSQRAIRSIWSEPGLYAIYTLKNAEYLWLGHPAAGWDSVDLYDWQKMCSRYPYSPAKPLNMFVARQLPSVPLVDLVILAVRRRIWPLVPLGAMCAYLTLVHMITWAEVRYSEPLHPLLAVILAIAGPEG